MQFSIGKLTAILIGILMLVTVVTTGVGLHILQANVRTLEDHHHAEANDALRNATLAIRNQVRFYQGMLQLIARSPQVNDLLEFAEPDDIVRWSEQIGRLMPGTLGVALAHPDGDVYGDPLSLRVGPSCQMDMRHFAEGKPIQYPLLHNDLPGLEHFDLVTRVTAADGSPLGNLFISFRLSIIQEILAGLGLDADQFVLIGADNSVKLRVGNPVIAPNAATYRHAVPDTAWQLALYRPRPTTQSFVSQLLLIDGVVLGIAAVIIVLLIRRTLGRFKSDLSRVHVALEQVLDGRYELSDAPTAFKETALLLPGIEQLAVRIQNQRNELRHQSLSDPLTGVFNRRYFDLMLAHLHEQSHRQAPAALAIIDLNDFKHINDQFGHACGDRALQRAATHLRARVRATDIVARLGGDEFAVMLTNIDFGRVEDWLRDLIEEHDRSIAGLPDGQACACQFSVGVATIDAEIYPTPTDVFAAADEAMYTIKQQRSIRTSRYAIAAVPSATRSTLHHE